MAGDDMAITIKVVGSSGVETQFQVKKFTKMEQIFEEYAEHKAIDPKNLRFMYDGVTIGPGQTPKMLELLENSQIDVLCEQVGGGDDEVVAQITIKVRDQAGDEMQFKVKKTTRMEKIFEAYAGRKGVPSSALRFMFDGTQLKADNTPKMFEMEENDQVDVFIEQQGGGDEEEGNEPITIKVKESTGDEMQFKVKKSTRMAKIFDAYAGRKGVPVLSLKFMLDGARIKADDTPKMLELEEGDQIDVLLEQTGGDYQTKEES